MEEKSREGRTHIPSGEQTVWVDVSTLIQSACNDLDDGQLIHGENFSLFASMSALEIMDPKMDSGMENSGYHSVEEAIENGAAPVPISSDKSVDVQCVVDIMDHLLACEATWHKGHPLAQTVFSCLYLLRLERTSSHPLLHSYCRIVRVTCNAIISVVSDARTHEEEDFFTMAYGLTLKGDGDDKCLSMLNAVEESISRQLRAHKATTSKRKPIEDIMPLQINPDLKEGYCKALLSRLRFRKHFFHVLTCMKKSQGRGLELARKHIASCLTELAFFKKSLDFLQPNMSSPMGQDKTTASGCQPIGFDASLNYRLSAPSPPRSVQILSWNKTVEYFEKLLLDLDSICSFHLDPSLEMVLQFVVRFQKSQPDLVARAHLQLLLLQDGKLYGKDPIRDVIFRTISLGADLNVQEFWKSEFVVHLEQLVIKLLKIVCANAAWQRRKLGKILQEWRVTSVQLELVLQKDFCEMRAFEENLSMKVIKNLILWIDEQTYWTAARFLMLGFELDLYSRSEFCMVYWYLYVVFIKLFEKAQARISGNNDVVKRKGKKKKDIVKDASMDVPLAPSISLLQCYVCLCEGLAMMLAALRNENGSFQRVKIFNTEEEAFFQHFELLLKAQVPENASYLLFEECTNRTNFTDVFKYNRFRDVQRIAKELRASYVGNHDKLVELQQLEQVAEHNRIALAVIYQVGIRDPTLNVSFEFSHHPCFATAVVKRS